MELSPQQDRALIEVERWLEDWRNGGEKQVFRLFGYAGTGKTTCARRFAEDAGHVLFAAYTGKAALCLRKAGCRNASTIHSLIYRPQEKSRMYLTELLKQLEDLEEGDPRRVELEAEIAAERVKLKRPSFSLNEESELSAASLLVVDECSMVGESMASDLLSFGTPILVLGDPAQLPPVRGTGYFTDAEPDVLLTEIHRQARDNPIVSLATRARERGNIPYGTYGESSVVRVAEFLETRDQMPHDVQVITGRNATRRRANQQLRGDRLGVTEDQLLVEGEKLVCLQNNHDKGLLNGALFRVEGKPEPTGWDTYGVVLRSEDDPDWQFEAEVHAATLRGEDLDYWEAQGAEQMDYGYALTCHKSQGSQWDEVVVVDESRVFRKDKYRWLYTAITRAAERVRIVR